MESLLAEELRDLRAGDVRETRAGVAFSGTLPAIYRACLWSRLASRILLPLREFPAPSPEALYRGACDVPWEEHLGPDDTFAVHASVSGSAITHSHYAALKVKDALADRLRAAFGRRPSVDVDTPDLRINLHLQRDHATLSLDLSGESLHRRGYRARCVEAPLKENLAAAILLRAGWPALAREGAPLVDPMCGSGTLALEAALMAADIAPGLRRARFGFHGWRRHDAAAWAALVDEARERRRAGLARLPAIHGYDGDPRAVDAARRNAARAGLAGRIALEVRALADCRPIPGGPGLVVANPPYGERLGTAATLAPLYAELGEALRRCYPGWRAAVLTANAELGHRIGLRARRLHTLYNGALACRLLHFEVAPPWHAPAAGRAPAPRLPEPFVNRLRKNWRHRRRWAAREGIHAFRVYDADVREYNFAIDVYEGAARWVHAHEYRAPAGVDARAAARRREQALAAMALVLDTAPEHVFLKVRQRQKGRQQYEKLADTGRLHEIREGPCRFLVNFTDYLDTGLFLDHRLTRALIGRLARGRRFLNLFGYTGTATVHAALGGAPASTTVDLSRTYLDWARRNFALNGLAPPAHVLVQADVREWLERNSRERYGLVFLDPPTFSRSKRMSGTLDVQRDHVALIWAAARLLEPDGLLVFSTNFRQFRLEREALAGLLIEDITRNTLPPDFARTPSVHACFLVRRRAR
jgi:23S rRNA (guanine2445-N2)-methyltransferase / 23S rRNA (guanine2069-N7)-methyltransferase